ncbi:MAG TPA: HAMP domain-containing sensor histidine kinase, partial [Longimicrobiales bacterium]|nr:HAMP domain-containing sensor histidine kinase [Longimicrobiales bacterium]
EAAFDDPERTAVPRIVERITLQPSIYAVLVYDAAGQALFRPDTLDLGPTPAQVGEAIATGRPQEVERTLGDVDVYSVVLPILRDDGSAAGAFEVAQPLAFLEQEKARTRARFLLNTLVLFGALTALIRWMVRTQISNPLSVLRDGVRTFGEGRLEHRLRLAPSGGELADVAAEFNRMADSLEETRNDLMRSAEERLALAQHMRHSEKMAAIGQLVAGLAHEIGAPLHVIRGRADLLAGRTAHSETESRDLRIIVEQIDRITGIVRSLLDFARLREPLLDDVEVAGVVEGVCELLATEAHRAGVDVSLSADGEAVVRGDRDQLQQVFLNLLLNAVQALHGWSGARRIAIAVAREAGAVGIEVSDTGPGIPPASRDRVFEPFFTTKSDGTGTGLGLTVVRRIVEEHGGTVVLVPSPPPWGTTFYVRLPASREASVGN